MSRQHLSAAGLLLILIFAGPGCALFDNDDDDDGGGSPTAPSPTVTLDGFVGTWRSPASTTVSATSCGNVEQYTVTPISATTATVVFIGTCATNLYVAGTGTGTLSGDKLSWGVQGTVNQGGVTCPFTFQNSGATGDAGGLRLEYSGTVCGISVSGAETLHKQ